MGFNCVKHHFNRIRKRNSNFYSQASIHCKKCLFVHIPKTGGISISKAIYGNLGIGHRSIEWSRKHLDNVETYYIFTIVRDPIDRFISAVNYLLEGGVNGAHSEWCNRYFMDHDSINQFITEHLAKLINEDVHFKRQTSFLLNQGSIDKDIEVFYYENFRLIEVMLLQRFAKKALRTNVTQHKKFVRTDLSTGSIVALQDAYRADYELLKYKNN